MTGGSTVMVMRGWLVAILTALLVQACAEPAKVVLYEERQQRIQAANRQLASTRPLQSVSATAARPSAVVPDRGRIEVRPLPPPAADARQSARDVTPQAVGPAVRSVTAVTTHDRRGIGSYQPVPTDGFHAVAPKETVYAISRRYGVPVRSLLVINRMQPPYVLRPGQRIRVPAQRRHVVAKGETVYAISRRYDVSVMELVRLNAVGRPYTIKIGQTLLLPDSEGPDAGRAAVAAATDSASPVPAPSAGESAVAAATKPKRVVLPPSTNIPRPSRLSGKGFLWPVSGPVISRFGAKGRGLHNDGINIAARRGTPVLAAQNGVVAYRGNELRGFGNLILIKHAKGYMTAYAHVDKILVRRGQRVQRGQVIARVGSSGNVARPQLHFEIRKGRRPVNPANYLGRRRAAAEPSASGQFASRR